MVSPKAVKIRSFWEKNLPKDKLNPSVTAADIYLKELEISIIIDRLQKLPSNIRILDVGCGTGYLVKPLLEHLNNFNFEYFGIDYSKEMIKFANKRKKLISPSYNIAFKYADVTNLSFANDSFDVVIGERILINQTNVKEQKKAVIEIARVLKKNGLYLMFEGTEEGLKKLNKFRKKTNLPDIGEHWSQLKIREKTFIPFIKKHFDLIRTQRFGMYYLITRIIHPLLVAPEQPKYDAKINKVAVEIAKHIPNYEDIGHLAYFEMKKK